MASRARLRPGTIVVSIALASVSIAAGLFAVRISRGPDEADPRRISLAPPAHPQAPVVDPVAAADPRRAPAARRAFTPDHALDLPPASLRATADAYAATPLTATPAVVVSPGRFRAGSEEQLHVTVHLERMAEVALFVTTESGGPVRRLYRGEAGGIELSWDGKGDDGRLVGRGRYRVVAESGPLRSEVPVAVD